MLKLLWGRLSVPIKPTTLTVVTLILYCLLKCQVIYSLVTEQEYNDFNSRLNRSVKESMKSVS